MKSVYQQPSLDIITFDTSNTVTTSGAYDFSLTGIGDEIAW